MAPIQESGYRLNAFLGDRGQSLTQQVGGQMLGQGGERPGTSVLVGDGGSDSQGLGQHAGPLVGRQVRG